MSWLRKKQMLYNNQRKGAIVYCRISILANNAYSTCLSQLPPLNGTQHKILALPVTTSRLILRINLPSCRCTHWFNFRLAATKNRPLPSTSPSITTSFSLFKKQSPFTMWQGVSWLPPHDSPPSPLQSVCSSEGNTALQLRFEWWRVKCTRSLILVLLMQLRIVC